MKKEQIQSSRLILFVFLLKLMQQPGIFAVVFQQLGVGAPLNNSSTRIISEFFMVLSR